MEKGNNKIFYPANERWLKDHNKKDWDIMFNKAFEVCKGIIRRMASGVKNLYSQEDLDDLALDATMKVMGKIKSNNILVNNITNFSWLWCRAMFTTYPMLKQNCFEREIIYTDDLESIKIQYD